MSTRGATRRRARGFELEKLEVTSPNEIDQKAQIILAGFLPAAPRNRGCCTFALAHVTLT